ncbi:ANTAR domain-containing protein [Pontibaca sp. S1109L]|uniref:ANTAR domain-containing protein n=2 Tax=Pontibaca salina TaxID=2795731 RepID=A0A934HSM3_9RHOB|nr:ANTAR domain-containing protein [Pontibaca salina]MBI6629960.1 ANTAR domain-containing protein [Pontibaca salina]
MSDVVFVAVRSVAEAGADLKWSIDAPPAAMVALLDYENPAIMEEAIRLGPHAVLGLPIRNFGAVASVFVALQNFKRQKKLNSTIKRLKSRIEGDKLLSKAKDVLLCNSEMTEEDAYKALRTHAMNKRVSIQEIAKSIVNAEGILAEVGLRPGINSHAPNAVKSKGVNEE